MPIEILMPALSPTMTEGNLASWNVSEGDTVNAGDVICEIETDKATMEVEAVDEGTIAKIIIAGGTEAVAVNSVIALLLEEGEDASALDGFTPSAGGAAPAAEAPAETTPAAAVVDALPTPVNGMITDASTSGRVIASPLARRIAASKGLDLSTIAGSGPRGRIVKRDVENAKPGTASQITQSDVPDNMMALITALKASQDLVTQSDVPSNMLALLSALKASTSGISESDALTTLKTIQSDEVVTVPNSNMRKIIAKRLTESARDIPHFNITMDVEIDKLLEMRKQLNNQDNADYKISVNDFVIKAAALALTRVPECNVSYTDEAILQYQRVDMSIAVAIEGGLITPIVKDAANKGLADLSNEVKDLAGRARDGKLAPEEFQGGTFTISNLGMFGVKGFNSIINPPQGGILSVGAGEQRPVVKDGELTIATVMTLTLAVDHRCIDGATGAAFSKELKTIIENPALLAL